MRSAIFYLESYLSQPLTLQPLTLCNSSFYFFLKGLFICVTHFMKSKTKNLTFSSLQANIGSKNKSPP